VGQEGEAKDAANARAVRATAAESQVREWGKHREDGGGGWRKQRVAEGGGADGRLFASQAWHRQRDGESGGNAAGRQSRNPPPGDHTGGGSERAGTQM